MCFNGYMVEEKMNKNRLLGLDVIKTIAMLFVIAIHIPLYRYDFVSDHSIGVFVQYALRMISKGVPLFFAVNGFLLLRRNELSIDRHCRTMLKIFLLLVFWGLFLILINLLYDGTPINRSLIIDLFLKTKGGSLYTGELWFLQALFAVYAIYPFLWLSLHKERKLYFVLFGLLLCFACIDEFLNITTSVLNNQIHIEHLNHLNLFIGRLKLIDAYEWDVLYFMSGGLVSLYSEEIQKRKMLFTVIWFVVWLSFFFLSIYISTKKNQLFVQFIDNSSILQLISIFFVFSICLGLKNTGAAGKLFSQIGSNTFGIYVTHQFFIRISRLLIPQDLFVERFLIMLMALAFSFFFTKIMRRIPYLKHLFEL